MVPVVLSSLAFSLGGVFMKPSSGFTRVGPSLMVTACFMVGTVLLARAVQQEGLGVAYVVTTGIEALLSVGVAMLILDERLSAPQAGGILLIVAGLVAMRLG